jgi:hypothetical protein
MDLDGTLTNLPGGGWLTPFYRWHLDSPSCTQSAGTTLDGGVVCRNDVALRRLSINGVSPSRIDFQVCGLWKGGQGRAGLYAAYCLRRLGATASCSHTARRGSSCR